MLQSLRASRGVNPRTVRRLLFGEAAAVQPHRGAPRQLLADVSVISRHDAGTGIQRVVRELLRELVLHPPPGLVVRPVCAHWRHGFCYAESYRAMLAGPGHVPGPSGPVRVHAGDVFIGMDWAARTLPRRHVLLARWRFAGVRMFFIVYDLLPALHPEWFSGRTARDYLEWIRTVAIFADGALCISRAVSDELTAWFKHAYGGLGSHPPAVRWFHLGADPMPPRSAAPAQAAPERRPHDATRRLRVLMVGTIEPRKNHAQVLAAFELLWREGRDVELVIVGREGWGTAGVVKALRSHPESGGRLVWHENTADEQLQRLYGTADGLLMASSGEGFGLPLVEAAWHGTPVCARDIPVFREIGGDGAYYFRGAAPEDLARALRSWLDLIASGAAPDPSCITRMTWSESARRLIREIV